MDVGCIRKTIIMCNFVISWKLVCGSVRLVIMLFTWHTHTHIHTQTLREAEMSCTCFIFMHFLLPPFCFQFPLYLDKLQRIFQGFWKTERVF